MEGELKFTDGKLECAANFISTQFANLSLHFTNMNSPTANWSSQLANFGLQTANSSSQTVNLSSPQTLVNHSLRRNWVRQRQTGVRSWRILVHQRRTEVCNWRSLVCQRRNGVCSGRTLDGSSPKLSRWTILANCSPVYGELHANSRKLGERLVNVRQVHKEVAEFTTEKNGYRSPNSSRIRSSLREFAQVRAILQQTRVRRV